MTERRILEGRVIVVTGGGRGVGRAHALACARAGAAGILLNDLGCDGSGVGADPSVAEAGAAELVEAGTHAVPDTNDVGAPAGAQRIVQHALDTFGRVDAVIGAAGIGGRSTLLKLDDAKLSRMIDVHIRGGFALIRAAARAMIDGGHDGSITLHTAPVAFFGGLRQSSLAATSAAVVGLVRSAAIELRKHGIRVNAIAPTARTRATEDLPRFKGIAANSMGPEFVGPVGAFLASTLSADVSGEVVGVAGTRIYALHGRETPGWFGEGEPTSPTAIADVWGEVNRS